MCERNNPRLEITPEMEAAGIAALMAFESEDLRFSREEAVRSIYRAMSEAVCQSRAATAIITFTEQKASPDER